MKTKILLIFSILLSAFLFGQITFYSENFDDQIIKGKTESVSLIDILDSTDITSTYTLQSSLKFN